MTSGELLKYRNGLLMAQAYHGQRHRQHFGLTKPSKRIPAKQAMEWGIVTECVADTELEKATDRLVDELRAFSPIAQRTAKKLLNDTEDSTLSIAIELEGHCYSRLRQSEDFKEGVEAFNAKRPPKFVGR